MGLFSKGLGVAEKGIKLAESLTTDKDALNEIKKEIILSEINSDSKFLKNARPSVIYFGIVVILFELLGIRFYLLNFFLDTENYKQALNSSENILQFFLVTWGSISTAYVVGRSNEKKNAKILKK